MLALFKQRGQLQEKRLPFTIFSMMVGCDKSTSILPWLSWRAVSLTVYHRTQPLQIHHRTG